MDYLLAYGSLLSRYSREHYSGLMADVVSVKVHGWSRSWCARYMDESATYAGATRNNNGHLHAVLVPVTISDELKERERNYKFVELDPTEFDVSEEVFKYADTDCFWICEVVKSERSNKQNPLPQSYVDTCLIGCIETGGIERAKDFVQQTSGWGGYWINDRHLANPIFPRYAPLNEQDTIKIDTVLSDSGILKYRTDYSC